MDILHDFACLVPSSDRSPVFSAPFIVAYVACLLSSFRYCASSRLLSLSHCSHTHRFTDMAVFSSIRSIPAIEASSISSSSSLPFLSNHFKKPSHSCRSFRKWKMAGTLFSSRLQMSVTFSTQAPTIITDTLFADYKASCAFFFPGQGAQAVGMAKQAESVPVAAELFAKANSILGYDLLEVCINGPKEKLDSTVVSQPAIYVTSLAAIEALRAKEGGQEIIDSVDVTCGLSLGEYTSLAFAGVFSFEDGLKLVKLRGEAMQAASDMTNGGMVSIIGLDADRVQALCDAVNEEVGADDRVQIANYLCNGNYAVSGAIKGIQAVESKAKSFKARMTVRLAVAGAFHTQLMRSAVPKLEAALAATEFKVPRIPVISNVDAQPHSDPSVIKKILAQQVTSPVQWESTLKTLLAKELRNSYEIGPGKVIAGLLKRIDKSASIDNVNLSC